MFVFECMKPLKCCKDNANEISLEMSGASSGHNEIDL